MTYGIPHTVRGWDPTDIVTTVVEELGDLVPKGFTAVVRRSPSPVILVPTVALTPVDTTPAEPEPGAWLIGTALFIREPRDDEPDHNDRPGLRSWLGVGFHIRTWAEVWDVAGGPGITPRRLVPEPEPVELPWDPNPLDVDNLDQTRTSVRVASDGWIHDENVVSRVGNVLRFTPDDAEAKGWALISAAHAAREVKP